MANNRYLYLESPAACHCGKALTIRQRQRWAYHRNYLRKHHRPPPLAPSCCLSHASELMHLRHPDLAVRAGQASFVKRKDKLFSQRYIETCPLPPGLARDRAMWRAGYAAGRSLLDRRMRRAEKRRALREPDRRQSYAI